jgi:CRISPR-associated protein Cpf1
LQPISESLFSRTHFNECLSQAQIEKYNAEIGDANFIINLYNQAHRKVEKFKRLPAFKILYKQIGCGEKDPLFFKLTNEKKSDAEQARLEDKDSSNKYYSAEEVLNLAATAGKRYFQRNAEEKEGDLVDTLPEFIAYVLGRKDYNGFYWSKIAINTISNKYFTDWKTLSQKLKAAKIFKGANKDGEEDVRVPDAVELQPLFEVLDQTADWQKDGLFKNNQEEKRRKIIDSSVSAHEALLKMIFEDARVHADKFLVGIDEVESVTSDYFSAAEASKEKENKKKVWKESIKAWMDHALAVEHILKYFRVREGKIKGRAIDDILSKALDILFEGENKEVDWFKWYDGLRNLLTQKPQDEAKENKLRLNFENGSLLGGWSDGQEKTKAAVLLRNDGYYYLGILRRKGIFDTEKEGNPVYENNTNGAGRLILANLKFQTLAGKGFLGKNGISYGEMGESDPKKAIECLKEIIKERYIENYPLLKQVLSHSYPDKKTFDKDVQEILKESYVCEFTGINWEKILQVTDAGEMYLFKISCKDFSDKASGKRDLQTIYWDSLFENNTPHQLNGGGEIFYRKQALKNKRIKLGYEKKKWVIEEKRFTREDGIFSFHCPVKLNYKSPSQSKPGITPYQQE